MFNTLKRRLARFKRRPDYLELLRNIGRLTRDDADGRCYRRSIGFWSLLNRPITLNYHGVRTFMFLEGPNHVVGRYAIPLCARIEIDGDWIILDPVAALQLTADVQKQLDDLIINHPLVKHACEFGRTPSTEPSPDIYDPEYRGKINDWVAELINKELRANHLPKLPEGSSYTLKSKGVI